MNKLISRISAVATSLLVAGSAFAQVPVQPIPDPYGPGLNADDILDFVASFANYFFTFAGILMGIIIVWAGVVYMSAGSNASKVGQARSIFTNGVIGAAIIFAIGLILATLRVLVQAPGGFF